MIVDAVASQSVLIPSEYALIWSNDWTSQGIRRKVESVRLKSVGGHTTRGLA